jgi:trk system potassium uptake protein TrkH
MLIGGCVGSTSGGFKVLRVSILGRLLRHRLNATLASPLEVLPRYLGSHRLERSEIDRTVAVAVAWGLFLWVGWMVVTLIEPIGGWASLSGIASALGNVGPQFIPPETNAGLSTFVKLLYAVAMIAGRLEVLPVIILFSRRTWR